MRKFKTAERNRVNYVYFTAEGKRIVIEPGMIGSDNAPVTEDYITLLHEADDADVNAERRYHTHVTANFADDGDWIQRPSNLPLTKDKDTGDHRVPRMDSSYLSGKSHAVNPLDAVLESIEEEEHTETIERLKSALSTLTDAQKDTVVKKFWLGETNVQIAREQGITETAVRKHLKGIYKILAEKI